MLAERAFELRMDGKQWKEIAQAIGCSPQKARAYFYHAYDARCVPIGDVERWREDELKKLRQLREAVWPRAISGLDDKALASALAVHDRIAKMLGLNAPEKVELNITIKAALMASVVKRLDSAMNEAGVPVETQQIIAAAILQGSSSEEKELLPTASAPAARQVIGQQEIEDTKQGEGE